MSAVDAPAALLVRGQDCLSFLKATLTRFGAQEEKAFHSLLLTPQGKVYCTFLVCFSQCQERSRKILLRLPRLYAPHCKRTLESLIFDQEVWVEEVSAEDVPHSQAMFDLFLPPLAQEREVVVPYWRYDTQEGGWKEQGIAASCVGFHKQRIANGWPALGVDFVPSEFLPSVLGYDTCGMVDFHKGCFIGQEVVSRVHRKGLSKKKLHSVYGLLEKSLLKKAMEQELGIYLYGEETGRLQSFLSLGNCSFEGKECVAIEGFALLAQQALQQLEKEEANLLPLEREDAGSFSPSPLSFVAQGCTVGVTWVRRPSLEIF